jgi:melanoma-associated antigen
MLIMSIKSQKVDLRAMLRRLQLPATAHIPSTNQSTHKNVTVDAYLNSLIRQGYLQRHAAGDPKAKRAGGSGKRGRSTQGGEDDGITWEWRWGHRAQSEIGEKGLAQFMAEFMMEAEKRDANGDEDEAEGDGEGRAARQRKEKREAAKKKKLEALLKGIGRAAGGNLADIK